jgi:hypothetical protein
MNYPLQDELLLIRGSRSFLLVAKTMEKFALCIETMEEEYCQGVQLGDLVIVSAPEGGAIEPALMLAELVRTYHLPLLVLPKSHPGSRRIRYVVSVGPEISTNCSIRRGTHPDQHLICSSDELAGLNLKKTDTGVEMPHVPNGLLFKRVKIPVFPEIM